MYFWAELLNSSREMLMIKFHNLMCLKNLLWTIANLIGISHIKFNLSNTQSDGRIPNSDKLKFWEFLNPLINYRKALHFNEFSCHFLVHTAQKMKFFIMDFFSKCDQIRSELRILAVNYCCKALHLRCLRGVLATLL